MSDFFLGIDTSNYKTSAAIVDENGRIVSDQRKLLSVTRGKRGLRQQEAVFQHTVNLPEILESLFAGREYSGGKLRCAAVSSRPRPVDGSYMPVFLSGMAAAGAVSAAMKIPLYEFSHQEGHIAAIQYYSEFKEKNRFVTFHFSGGTTEAILIDREKGVYDLVGGSRDISFGQLLDRTGVALGFDFPAGEAMDEAALKAAEAETPETIRLPVIRCPDGFINLSGIETHCRNLIREHTDKGSSALIYSLFGEITRTIARMTVKISEKNEIDDFIYAGGVSASGYIRKHLLPVIRKKSRGITACFGEPALSSDNAVGIALLGMEQYRRERSV
jgi:N6-L-threonylcarbamoyladenine synthase